MFVNLIKLYYGRYDMYTYKNHTEAKIKRIKEAAEVILQNPHMTQEELGELFGVEARTIRSWIKSYQYIDIEGYKKIKDNFEKHLHVRKKLGKNWRMGS